MIIKTREIGEIEKPAAKPKTDIPKLRKFQADIVKEAKPPKSGGKKHSITIRLDPEIIDFFKEDGMGWQSRINAILLEHVRSRKGR